MIFPGMDPYLEHPRLWSGVHASLMVYIRDHLRERVRPRYIAAVEERVYLEEPDREIIPDDSLRQRPARSPGGTLLVEDPDAPVIVQTSSLAVREAFGTILDRQAGMRVVTVIEVVSPTNKYAGPGRKLYKEKQGEVLASSANLVEIDLLRTGPHVLAVPEYLARGQGDYHYLCCVNRAQGERDAFELYPRCLEHPLPRIAIPLADPDPDVRLDLPALLAQVYELGSYQDRINYEQPCVPPLTPAEQDWANQILTAQGVLPPKE